MKRKSRWGGSRIPSEGKKLGAPVRQKIPEFSKKFRATLQERQEFYSFLTGDSRRDFIVILNALRKRKEK